MQVHKELKGLITEGTLYSVRGRTRMARVDLGQPCRSTAAMGSSTALSTEFHRGYVACKLLRAGRTHLRKRLC